MDCYSSLAAEVFGSAPDNLPFDPRESIPLTEIKGSAEYCRHLSEAACDLHSLLKKDPSLQEAKGQPVVFDDHDYGKLPSLKQVMTTTKDGPALEVLLHSLAHIGSAPTKGEGKGKERKVKRQTCLSVPMGGRGCETVSQTSYYSSSIKKFVLALIQYGWLEAVPSHFDAGSGERYRTRVKPTKNFLDWMLEKKLIFAWHGQDVKPGRNANKIKPKASTSVLWISKKDCPEKQDKEGTQIPADPLYRDLIEDEIILPVLNNKLGKQKVECPLGSYSEYEKLYDYKKGIPKNPFRGQQLYRQFVLEDNRAGRLFGHWVQRLPSENRSILTIDGKPTVELDYSSMQLALLYAIKGVPLPDDEDLYALPGMVSGQPDASLDREDMKLVLTHSVGNPTKQATIASIWDDFRKQNRKHGEIEILYDRFWQHHTDVCPHGNGISEAAWPQLQHLESQIALRVLRKLLDQGITSIPIHDSFIVQERYADIADKVMQEAFAELCPGTSVGIKRTSHRLPL